MTPANKQPYPRWRTCPTKSCPATPAPKRPPTVPDLGWLALMRCENPISLRTRGWEYILRAIDSILVTGAFGLVGSAVVNQLHADGRRVVATAHHTVNAALANLYGVEVRMVDLTKPAQVNALVARYLRRPSSIWPR